MKKKCYKAIIKGYDNNGMIVKTETKDFTDQELAAVLYAVLEDVIDNTGKSFNEIVEVLSDYFVK